MTLTFNPLTAIVTTYSHAKFQGQRSVGSEDVEWKQTDGLTDRRTDGGDRITCRINAVGDYEIVA